MGFQRTLDHRLEIIRNNVSDRRTCLATPVRRLSIFRNVSTWNPNVASSGDLAVTATRRPDVLSITCPLLWIIAGWSPVLRPRLSAEEEANRELERSGRAASRTLPKSSRKRIQRDHWYSRGRSNTYLEYIISRKHRSSWVTNEISCKNPRVSRFEIDEIQSPLVNCNVGVLRAQFLRYRFAF